MLYSATVLIMVISTVILITQTWESGSLPRRSKVAFTVTFSLVALSQVSEWGALQLNGAHVAAGVPLLLCKLVDYMATPGSAVAMAFSLGRPPCPRLALGVLGLNCLFQLASLLTGWTFYVDNQGIYRHGPLYAVYMVVVSLAIVYLAAAIVKTGGRHRRRNVASLFMIVVLVVTGFVLQNVSSQMRVANCADLFAVAMIFIHFREYGHQDMEDRLDNSMKDVDLRQRMLATLARDQISLHLVDLTDETVLPIVSNETIDGLIAPHATIRGKITSAMQALTTPNYLEPMMLFIDFDSLPRRLHDRDAISIEFVGIKNGWCRAAFTVVNRDEDGYAVQVLYSVTAIDEQKRFEAEIRKLSVTDVLTGLMNQRGYKESIELLLGAPLPENLVMVAMDVNGLKVVNDTFGHSAGDELLVGVGQCLSSSFGGLGTCYRLGGDEFAAILHCDKRRLDEALEDMRRFIDGWTHPIVPQMSISVGYAALADHPAMTLKELEDLADSFMYEDKRRFYETHGMDRRRGGML